MPEAVLRRGLIISRFGSEVDLEDETGHLRRCAVRKKLKSLVCGDRVHWEETGGDCVVTDMLPRTTLLSRPDSRGRMRPVAANIDQIAIITATVPALNEGLIDRYLVAAETLDLIPVIVLNKTDLLDDAGLSALRARLAAYVDIGYEVLYTSAKREHGLDSLRAQLGGRTSILVGQSGVGKSSIINAILPHAEARVAEVSEATGKGRHTTTAARLYHLDEGGQLIDSPGVREFGLWDVSARQVAHGFREFRTHANHCRFTDCSHRVEPGCAVREAVEDGRISRKRLESYYRILESLDQ